MRPPSTWNWRRGERTVSGLLAGTIAAGILSQVSAGECGWLCDSVQALSLVPAAGMAMGIYAERRAYREERPPYGQVTPPEVQAAPRIVRPSPAEVARYGRP